MAILETPPGRDCYGFCGATRHLDCKATVFAAAAFAEKGFQAEMIGLSFATAQIFTKTGWNSLAWTTWSLRQCAL